MCKSNLEIRFCTCEIKNSGMKFHADPEQEKEEYYKKHFIWTLRRYFGEKETGMLGQMIMPVEKLNEDLTASYLLNQLNSKNLFDFDYSPTEGDNLEIRQDYLYSEVKGFPRQELYNYLSFIFRKGKWVEEVYDVFSDKTRRFKKGTLEIEVKF